MLVDDLEMNRFVVQKMLQQVSLRTKLKYEIIESNNGEEALQKYRQNLENNQCRIKMIFMDCEMPVLDGYQASKEIREIEKAQGI